MNTNTLTFTECLNELRCFILDHPEDGMDRLNYLLCCIDAVANMAGDREVLRTTMEDLKNKLV